MVKIYVVDTNILLQAPYAIDSFEDNLVVLPMVVLEELDHFKKAEGETGANARRVIRYLEQFRQKGDLLEGVPLEGGGTLYVEKNFVNVKLREDLSDEAADNRILRVCLGLAGSRDEQVILVTKDLLLRIKAQILGICAEDFTTDQVLEHENQYSGRCELYVPEELFKEFKKKGVPADQTYVLGEDGESYVPKLEENQFVILKADQSAKKTQLGRVVNGMIRKLEFRKSAPYGISPRNAGQYFLQEALMQPAEKAPLVIVKGMAGTAKTFYTLAVGLHAMLEQEEPAYRRILISRPNAQFDDDIGFLPGDESEKIAPLLRPVVDNLELLVDQNEKERFADERSLSGKVEELFDRRIVDAQALNFIRGRSISKTYLVIDESQNLTPKQAKGIITRAGMGTKIILLGDPQQIDHPLLDERTNGLSYAAEKMKGSPLCWQVTMSAEECERSALAMDAVKRM